jgi:C4-type Zn-finger protein
LQKKNNEKMKKNIFETTHKCVICKGDIEIIRNVDGIAYWNRGHNAWPVAKGNCCYKCEEKKVIPRRKLQLLFDQKKGA